MTRDASACEKHFPPVISGESGRRPPPRRFAPRGQTSPYSPEMTGGTYISGEIAIAMQPATRRVCVHVAQALDLSSMQAPLFGLRGCLM